VTSRAEASFARNCADIEELLQVHADVTAEAPGRRRNLEAVHKSAIVLLTAFWEAFCEDLAGEALRHLVDHAPDARALPAGLRKQVAKELSEAKDVLEIWTLADKGWRSVLLSRLEGLQERRNLRLSNPTTRQVNDLFRNALGIEEISQSWRWSSMSAQRAAGKLDEYIIVRHEVAHRGSSADRIWKADVKEYRKHIRHLVERTAAEVGRVLTSVTGVVPWPDEAAPGEGES
jgi:hypothetical protein